MKKVLVLVAVLSVVGVVSAAQIDLFWSTTGISDPALMYSTALTNFQPAFVAPTPVTQLLPGTYDLFLWGQFQADWAGYQIYGIDLKFEGTATHTPSVGYRQRIGAVKRWDGSAGILLDGVMAAVTAAGIVNNPGHLVQADGKFLIGATNTTGALNDTLTMSLHTTPGLGIACRDAEGNEVPDPTIIPATVTFVPEPASVLLALAGLLIRRR
jgi:hypothetical protein